MAFEFGEQTTTELGLLALGGVRQRRRRREAEFGGARPEREVLEEFGGRGGRGAIGGTEIYKHVFEIKRQQYTHTQRISAPKYHIHGE